jgi:ribosomal protein S7
MMNGRNNGKKLMAVRIVAHAFEIVRTPLFDDISTSTSLGNTH